VSVDEPGLLTIGQIFEGYEVVRLLGKGGYSEVYEIRDEAGRRHALKILCMRSKLDRLAAKRLVQEGRILLELHDANVVEVRNTGIDAHNLVYLVMEYLTGTTLRELMRNEAPLPIERALDIAEQMARGLRAAHGAGVVHRDVKPENVFVIPLGAGKHLVKLIDFGIAKHADVHFGTTSMIGTPAYMAPDFLMCSKGEGVKADPRWDLYAACLIAYEAIAGRHPFQLRDGRFPPVGTLITKQLREAIPPLARVAPGCPEPVAALIMRGLDKDPARRWSSADELEHALREQRVSLFSPEAGASPLLPSRLEELAGWTPPEASAPGEPAPRTAAPAAVAPTPRPGATAHVVSPLDRVTDKGTVRIDYGQPDPPRPRPVPAVGGVPAPSAPPAAPPLAPVAGAAGRMRRPALRFDLWDLALVAALAAVGWALGMWLPM
jgi:eukaryotic-like serine/threonine-protein kinase